MADFFLDVSAVDNEYQAYTGTPTTWAVPQDGNGRAGPGHSAAVAIAAIDVAGCTASGTGTIGVLGVTVSSTLNASGAALATAIATAINASTTATAAGVCLALLPLNRLVFARVNPGVNTQVQIMLRIAGVDWNGMAPTQANISPAATIGAFAGGANGPFAYFNATTAVFGRSVLDYGIGARLTSGTLEPGSADFIYVRTRRAGVNLGLSFTSATSYTLSPAPTAGFAFRNYVFDGGAVWSGDAGVFTFSLALTGNSANITFQVRQNTEVRFASGDAQKRWRVNFIMSGSTSCSASVASGSGAARLHLERGTFDDDGSTGPSGGFGVSFTSAGSGNFRAGLHSDSVEWRLRRGWGTAPGSNGTVKIVYRNNDFNYTALTGNVTGIVTGNTASCVVKFEDCRFRDVNGLYAVTSPIASTGSGGSTLITFEQCQGVDAVATSFSPAVFLGNRQMVWENFGPYRDWRVEDETWIAEWRYGQNFPTLDAVLPNGTPWSVRVLCRTGQDNMHPQKPYRIGAMYRGSTGVKTVTLELLAQTDLKKANFGIGVSYIDKDNVPRYESSLEPAIWADIGTSTNLDSSTASWTLNGTVGYSAKKLSVTTAYELKSGSELVVNLLSIGNRTTDVPLFVNPAVSIA